MPYVQILCGGCDAPMSSPFYVDSLGRERCKTCFDAVPVKCEHCPEDCPPNDRTPTRAGGVAHAVCALRLANAMAFQSGARTVAGVRLSGPAFAKGGRQ